MQNEFIHTSTINTFISIEGNRDLILISYNQAAVSTQEQHLMLRAGLFCDRLFVGNLPFIGYLQEDANRFLIKKKCAEIHKNVYMLPIDISDILPPLTESKLMVCNTLMWELLKNEDTDFDPNTYHKRHNVYQLCIVR
ncbi:MAG: hypothetical protein OXM61_10655 [Candidatus Poribacteria bacterium]|nr:hypothetical protein [Candidatus Poribacteria bacterium]